jgi:uncharacterized protein YebE (UPF0316 family)
MLLNGMLNNEFLDSDFFNWVVLPILIFISRLCDVTLGTLRHIFISKGLKTIVPIFGFIEMLIWLIAISQLMKHLNNFACYIAFAGGFSAGTYVGMWIEEKLALGMQIIRLITNFDPVDLISKLQKTNIGATLIDAKGTKGDVKVIFIVIERKNAGTVINLIHEHNPKAFYSIEDVRIANQGVFRNKNNGKNTFFQFDYIKNIFSNKGKR